MYTCSAYGWCDGERFLYMLSQFCAQFAQTCLRCANAAVIIFVHVLPSHACGFACRQLACRMGMLSERHGKRGSQKNLLTCLEACLSCMVMTDGSDWIAAGSSRTFRPRKSGLPSGLDTCVCNDHVSTAAHRSKASKLSGLSLSLLSAMCWSAMLPRKGTCLIACGVE